MPDQNSNTVQLLVFEKKTPRSAWRYMSTYKGNSQEECNASEITIRKTFAALHRNDGVQWAVVAADPQQLIAFQSTKGVNRHRRDVRVRRRDPLAVHSLDGLGVVVLQFPEADDPADESTPRCVCGRMLAIIGERAICTGCAQEVPMPAKQVWTSEQILEREA